MRKLSQHSTARHGYLDLPRFAWAARHRAAPLTPGGALLQRRFGLPSAVANTVAELAGIGREAAGAFPGTHARYVLRSPVDVLNR
jgi:hypothetical protein